MPSISDALFAGRAGIQSHGTAISVLADNIANANTIAYKASRPEFIDLLAGSTGGSGTAAAGAGSDVNKITQIFNQGTFEFTGRGLDVGIDGNGFFAVQDSSNQRFYTRAGNFQVDADGNLLDQNGFSVLGFSASGAGGLTSLNVNQQVSDSVSTGAVDISGNLDASTALNAAIPALPQAAASFSTLADDADFQTFVDVFDSLGGKHTLNVYFFHEALGATSDWTVQVYAEGSEVTGGTAGAGFSLGEFTLEFDSDGTRATTAPTTGDFSVTTPWSNGADATQSIAFTLEPFTQFSAPSTINSLSQDGTGGGSVVSFNLDPDGTLFAQLDNGQRATVGTLALVNFSNVEGLRRLGNSLYAESTSSGQPVIGTPGTGQFGSLESGALELSTSDMAGDFIKLISLQRGFQGSSRIIGNINDLLSEIINLA